MQKVAVSASLRLQMMQVDLSPNSEKNRNTINHKVKEKARDFLGGIGTDFVPIQNLFCI